MDIVLRAMAQSSAEDTAAGVAAAGIGIFFLFLWLAVIIFAIAGMVFWIISLVHLLQHEDVKDRLLWIVLLFVAGQIAGYIYFFAIKRSYDRGGARDPNYIKH